MFNEIHLKHFKCFEELALPLRNLTVLTGTNASGKSSILQALVLLHQTIRENEWSDRLILNGPLLRMGAITDVIDKVHGREEFEIGLTGPVSSVNWTFSGPRTESQMTAQLSEFFAQNFNPSNPLRDEEINDEPLCLSIGYPTTPRTTPKRTSTHNLLPTFPISGASATGSWSADEVPDTTSLPEFEIPGLYVPEDAPPDLRMDPYEINHFAEKLRSLTYITAERIGPQDIYFLEDSGIVDVVGPKGEHAVGLLYQGMDKPVAKDLALPTGNLTQFSQVRSWMRKFFPNFDYELELVPKINAVTLGMRNSDDTGFHSPHNIGFGFTQILPVIVAGLALASSDDQQERVLLIENPEVHLHPSGQSEIGLFLGEIARAGVQVIVETHSDHVLNGIRRSVRSKRLVPQQVSIHFFQPRSVDGSQVTTPLLNSEGSIDDWPEGFFDQFDRDLDELAGWAD